MAESTIFEDKNDSGLVLDVKNPKDQNYLIFRQIDMDKSKILEHLYLSNKDSNLNIIFCICIFDFIQEIYI